MGRIDAATMAHLRAEKVQYDSERRKDGETTGWEWAHRASYEELVRFRRYWGNRTNADRDTDDQEDYYEDGTPRFFYERIACAILAVNKEAEANEFWERLAVSDEDLMAVEFVRGFAEAAFDFAAELEEACR